MILALDPSSTCTGYALGEDDGTFREAGVLRPRPTRLPFELRVQSMVTDLREFLRDHSPSTIVLEVPSGKIHGRLQRANGIINYGFAVGAIWLACCIYGGAQLHTVADNVWTRGRQKAKRQRELAASLPAYDAAKDKGADCADAIELMQWWAEKQRAEVAYA